MEQPTGIKLCECGCKRPAPIAKKNIPRLGHVQGEPIRFIHGHNVMPPENKPRHFVQMGQRCGRGVVIDPKVPYAEPSGRVLRGARFRCDCGNEYVAEIADVVNGRRTSCGCRRGSNFIDRTGQKYGKLIVLHRVPNTRKGDTRWLCRCDCGNEAVVRSASLSKGSTTSCGCLAKGPGKGFLPGQSAMNKVLDSYLRGARDRGLDWSLTREDFDQLTSSHCFYCGIAPGTVARHGPYSGTCLYNGIDRMDNTIGYIRSNVVPCCKACNFAKKTTPFGDFMAWIARLTEYHWFHPELTPSRLLSAG